MLTLILLITRTIQNECKAGLPGRLKIGIAVSVCPYQDANVFRGFLSIPTLL